MLSDIGSALEARAQEHPDRLLFSFYGGDGNLGNSYSYGTFLGRVNFVADALRGLGVGSGEPVLVAYPPGPHMAIALFAATMIGAIPVPTPPPHFGQAAGWARLLHIAESAGSRWVLTTAAIVDQVGPAITTPRPGMEAAARLEWIATDRFTGHLDSLRRSTSEFLIIQFTSGSTSAPRGVAVTHANAIHNAGLSLPRSPQIGVSWLPHFHDMGLLGYYVHCVVNGGASHFLAPFDFLRRPILWFDLISRTRATMTAAPNGAFDYCLRQDKVSDAQMVGLDLSSLRMMLNCAEPVRSDTIARFWQRFSRHGLKRRALVSAYGLAEHTLCVTIGGSRVLAKAADDGRTSRFVSCGRPARDVDLRIVDSGSRCLLEPGRVGEIWVDSPSKASGYWRQPKEISDVFAATIAGDASGRRYLRTGDLGFVDNGELFICGRLRDMLIVNGRNVFPADVEAVLEQRHPHHLAGRVVAFGIDRPDAGSEGLVVLVENGTEAIRLSDLRDLIEGSCSVPVSVIARVPRGTIVRTSSGKTARNACRQKWMTGAVEANEVLDPVNDSVAAIEAMLARFAATAAALGARDATLDRLGLDSITLVNLSLSLESLAAKADAVTEDWLEKAADISLILSLRISELTAAMNLFRAGEVSAVLDMFDQLAARIRSDETDRMRRDAATQLPDRFAFGDGDGDVLITGATGFLGAFLLKSLLERTRERIHVLVRGRDANDAISRVKRALCEAGWPADETEATFASRIGIVLGDLRETRFGLTGDAWAELASRVGRIYHCGAEVDYVKSYELLRGPNVTGTVAVLALLAEGRPKALHHVSTTFVFGWSNMARLTEADSNAGMQHLDFGYAQSKWVAEQLVLRARERGAAVTIYRPSLVTASAEGRFVRRDITVRTLGYMIRHGLTVDSGNQVSFLPVHTCADNIVALSLGTHRDGPVFHMTADGVHTLADICAMIGRRFGYRFRVVPLPEFVAHAHEHCAAQDELYPLLSFFDRNTRRIMAMDRKRYDSSAYRAARDRTSAASSHPSMDETVEWIVDYLLGEGLIPQPPSASAADGLSHAGVLA
ncbi:MAG: thioester reductase domain-containing protein [Rhizobiaceae bacterium]